MSNSNE
jgi:serine/threonine protein kinase